MKHQTLRRAQAPTEQASWTEVDGQTIHSRHWVRHGRSSPDPVVLVHGFGVGSRMCRPLAEQLALHMQVHAPDMVGFADSDKPDEALDIAELADSLAAWMKEIHLPPVTLVGVSFGSQVAAELARSHPGQVCNLVLASPIVDRDRRSWPAQIGRWQLERFTQSLRLQGIQMADMPKAGPRRLIRTFSYALDYRLEDTVSHLDQPTRVAWGSRDPLVSRAFAQAMADLAPRGSLAVAPGAVHAMSHDSPLELSRIVSHLVEGASVAEPERLLTEEVAS